MDTITLIRSAVRSLLREADVDFEAELRASMTSGDSYASNAKPHIDWDDEAERDASATVHGIAVGGGRSTWG